MIWFTLEFCTPARPCYCCPFKEFGKALSPAWAVSSQRILEGRAAQFNWTRRGHHQGDGRLLMSRSAMKSAMKTFGAFLDFWSGCLQSSWVGKHIKTNNVVLPSLEPRVVRQECRPSHLLRGRRRIATWFDSAVVRGGPPGKYKCCCFVLDALMIEPSFL